MPEVTGTPMKFSRICSQDLLVEDLRLIYVHIHQSYVLNPLKLCTSFSHPRFKVSALVA